MTSADADPPPSDKATLGWLAWLARRAAVEDRRRSCVGKKRYVDDLSAAFACREAKRLRGVDLTGYCCPYCGAFHIGHRPGWPRGLLLRIVRSTQ